MEVGYKARPIIVVICPSVMDGYLSQCDGWLFVPV